MQSAACEKERFAIRAASAARMFERSMLVIARKVDYDCNLPSCAAMDAAGTHLRETNHSVFPTIHR